MTPSILWPPNSILTATLLLAPVSRWWIYLLAALPAHLLVISAGERWPLALILALFATNCSEALLGAASVRRWTDAPARLDTLKRVLIFVAGAGLFGPFVSSFLDAGVVSSFRDEPYWLVWRTRLFSNILSELTVAPAIITGVRLAWPWIRFGPLRRKLELALLGVALALAAFAVFSRIPEEFRLAA
jgi:integral membrane sensor domain MASE1